MAGGTNTGDGTHGSYSKVDLKVSQTEPSNPHDGLLWYKPDLCITTTTTTEPCDYEGVLTVGNDMSYIGFGREGYVFTPFGNLNPDNELILQLHYSDAELLLETLSGNCCESITILIDNNEFIIPFDHVSYGNCVYKLYPQDNPFPAVGETCTIRICQMECTTTTTTKLLQ